MFAPVGALMAGTITYREYEQRRLGKGRALAEALRSGAVALLVLVAATGLLGWLLSRSP